MPYSCCKISNNDQCLYTMLVVAERMTPGVNFVLDEYTNSDSLLTNLTGLP